MYQLLELFPYVPVETISTVCIKQFGSFTVNLKLVNVPQHPCFWYKSYLLNNLAIVVHEFTPCLW